MHKIKSPDKCLVKKQTTKGGNRVSSFVVYAHIYT